MNLREFLQNHLQMDPSKSGGVTIEHLLKTVISTLTKAQQDAILEPYTTSAQEAAHFQESLKKVSAENKKLEAQNEQQTQYLKNIKEQLARAEQREQELNEQVRQAKEKIEAARQAEAEAQA